MSSWIIEASSEDTVSTIVRNALRQRLDRMLEFAPLAAEKSDEGPKYVHQLRVATRRARAVLDVFSDWLPKKRARRINSALRELRKAAGKARDLDVLLQRLTDEEGAPENLRASIKQLRKERLRSQKPLRRAVKDMMRSGLKKEVRQLIKRVRWRQGGAEPSFNETALRIHGRLVGDFFDKSYSDQSDIAALHELRICGKRLRYGMELLASAYDDSFRAELYPVFAEVQERIGIVNDHATAGLLVSGLMRRATSKKARKSLQSLAAYETRQLESTLREFRGWWTDYRISDLRARCERLTNSITPRPFDGNGAPRVSGKLVGY